MLAGHPCLRGSFSFYRVAGMADNPRVWFFAITTIFDMSTIKFKFDSVADWFLGKDFAILSGHASPLALTIATVSFPIAMLLLFSVPSLRTRSVRDGSSRHP